MTSSIQDLLPLTPLQEGFFFHSLYDAECDTYKIQLTVQLHGEVNSAELRSAAEYLLERHANLRACFLHENFDKPVQLIPRHTPLAWRELDLREYPEHDLDTAVNRALDGEKTQKFSLDTPPLMRFLLIRTATNKSTFSLTAHHILLDGWSAPLLLAELAGIYSGLRDQLPTPRPFRDYLAWLAQQDRQGALTTWRTQFSGLRSGTVVYPQAQAVGVVPGEVSLYLSSHTTEALEQLTQKHRLTSTTFINLAWALLLSGLTGSDEVVFGSVVSIRPAELTGAETMIGLFINTVPVRVRLEGNTTALDAATAIFRQRTQLIEASYLGLSEIQGAIGVGTLFDTAVVVENYPMDQQLTQAGFGGLTIEGFTGWDRAHFPLTLIAVPGEKLQLRIMYRKELVGDEYASMLMRSVAGILADLVSDPERAISDIQLSNEVGKAAQAWRVAFQDFDEPTLVAPHVDLSTTRSQTVRHMVTHDQANALQELADDVAVPERVVWEGAWGFLLGQLLNRDDVVFTATTPLRVRIDANEKVSDFLVRLHAEQLRVSASGFPGFAQLGSILGLGILCDVSVAFDESPATDTGDAMQLLISSNPLVSPSHRDVVLRFQPDALDRQHAQSHLDRLIRVLAAFTASPNTPMGSVSSLSEQELRQVVHAVNDTDVSHPLHLFHEPFEVQARLHPDALALLSEDASGITIRITYAELDARADHLAEALRESGAGPESLVAVALPRSVDVVVAVLAVHKAGAVYLPIDPSYPPERVRHMLETTTPTIGIASTSTLETLPRHVPTLVIEDPASWPKRSENRQAKKAKKALPDNAAYVIYTSGSTGKPKAVVVSHRGAAALLAAAGRQYDLHEGSRMLQFSSPSFDGMIGEVFIPLAHGATVTVVPAGIYGGSELGEFARRHEVTHAFLPPAVAVGLADEDLLTFDTLITGGDAMSVDLVRRMAKNIRLGNMYGPTETTVYLVSAIMTGAETTPVLGRPFDDTRLYLLDQWLQPVAPGMIGELYIGGPALARGYSGQPGVTATRFIADPFGGPGDRLYRTGDLGLWQEDGHMLYSGRVDHQIKIRGFRIEPGEVEQALMAHPDVDQSLVIGHKGDHGNHYLVAYITPATEARPDPLVLREHLGTTLPSHLVPSFIVTLDEFPLSPNRKVDRAALPAPESQASSDYVAPRTDPERLVADAFAKVLGAQRVGAFSNFFDLGGHSLLAVRLVNMIRKELSREVSVRDIFSHPTPATLVQRLTSGELRTPLVPADKSQPIPLSFQQERMWFLSELSALGVYNIPIVIRITGAIDIAALHRAWSDLACRHEIFRTRFAVTDGSLTQVVEPEPLVPLVMESVHPDFYQDIAENLVSKKFDLSQHEPYRAAILRITHTDKPDEHVFALIMHHIIIDGWSTDLLLTELFGRYQAYATGTHDFPAETLPVQYADYAVWQRALLGSYAQPTSLARTQMEFWRNHLKGHPAECRLPINRTRSARPTYAGSTITRDVSPMTLQRIRECARSSGTSEFMVLHAILTVTLLRLGAGTDTVIGTSIAGRNDPFLDSVLGLFVNTLALRVELDGNPDFWEVLDRVKEADTLAFANQDVPFEWIVETTQTPRQAGKNPLFQVALSVENGALADYLLAFEGFTAEPTHNSSAKFDLFFTVNTSTGVVALEYSEDLFEADTAEMIADVFQRITLVLLEHPETAVTEHEVTDEAPRGDALPASSYSETVCARFARIVAAHPTSTAISTDDGELSYEQLASLSDQYAQALIARGVRPGDRVGIAAANSTDYVTSALAVLKASAAYVPLDPKLPDERLNTIIEESEPSIIISDMTFQHRQGIERHELFTLAEDLRSFTGEDDLPITTTTTAESPACLLFTSGSTGKPKGIVLPHRSFLALALDSVADKMGSGRMLMHSAIAFDASALEMWAPLLHGGAIVLMASENRDLADYETFIRRHRVTSAFFTTALFNIIAVDRPAIFTALRYVLFGGEAASHSIVRKAAAAAPNTEFINGYGPTETFAFVLSHTVVDDELSIPIGSPNVLVEAYVLDENMRRVPRGCPGQLHIAGPQVALGYWQQPALTAKQFTKNAYGGGLLYATGDLVRQKTNGAFDYLGRIDRQVKIRGFRIELEEISTALTQLPEVGLAHIIVHREADLDDQLLAYVVPASGHTIDPHVAQRQLMGRLPAYMVPNVMVLNELPLTTNGKVDELALPRYTVATDVVTYPQSAAEKQVAAVFAEILGGSAQIDIHTDFFDLGGTSLSALKLVAAVSRTFKRDFSIIEMIDRASISRLAAYLTSEISAPATDQAFNMLVPAHAVPGTAPLFCVHPGVGFSWQYLNVLPYFQDRSVYLIQAKGWDNETNLPASIEEMASEYVRLIKTVSSDGPYHLLGWSFGGYLVHEIARQLQEDRPLDCGQNLMAILDAFPLEGSVATRETPTEHEIVEGILAGLGLPLTSEMSLNDLKEQIQYHMGREIWTDERIEACFRICQNNVALVKTFTPQPIRGKLLLFTAQQDVKPEAPGADTWLPYFPDGIIEHPVDQDHLHMLHREAIPIISAAIRDALSAFHT